jgi:hypothetical protein
MKGVKIVILALVVAVIVLSTSGMAAVPPPNTPEIQTLKTTTAVDAVGIVTENDALGWKLSSEVLDTNMDPARNGPIFDPENGLWYYEGDPFGDLDPALFHLKTVDDPGPFWTFPYWPQYQPFAEVPIYSNEPPLNDQEVQMTIAYDETTNAVNGVVTYNKNSAIHTGSQTLGNYNVKENKIVTFKALDGGKMTSEENMLLDNVGKAINVLDPETGEILPSTLCPFAPATIGNCTPAFCNIAQTGSRVEVYVGSLVTNAQSRSVGTDSGADMWPPLPIVDGPPVEMDYSIRLTGVRTGSTADGSAMAYFKAHKLEGSRVCPSGSLGAGQEITYNEVSSASGSITQFQKIINYKSGFKLTG